MKDATTVMIQIVASLTIIIYDRNMFMAYATAVYHAPWSKLLIIKEMVILKTSFIEVRRHIDLLNLRIS